MVDLGFQSEVEEVPTYLPGCGIHLPSHMTSCEHVPRAGAVRGNPALFPEQPFSSAS